MSEHIDIAQDGGVLTLTLNRPDKKNALTDAMYAALSDAMENAESDPAVRAVLILAAGDMFSAGNDIGDFLANSASGKESNVLRFLAMLASFSKPLLAGVQGRAVGIGTTMLLHCDYVVLSEDALLTTPFVGLGLVPEAASSLLLPARIGHQRAFGMLALGEALGAADAMAMGLANAVVTGDALAETAAKAAGKIAQLPPGAVQATKGLMRDTPAIKAKMDAEMAIFGERLQSEEAREAFTAFMEKRAPDFSRF